MAVKDSADDIAGLSERLLAEIGEPVIYRNDAVLREAATQLAALSARVKELEVERDHYLSNWEEARTYLNIETGHAEQAESRATRLQQERDEAVDLLRKMTDHSIDDALYPFAECFDLARDLVRRLAPGPEKEKKE